MCSNGIQHIFINAIIGECCRVVILLTVAFKATSALLKSLSHDVTIEIIVPIVGALWQRLSRGSQFVNSSL